MNHIEYKTFVSHIYEGKLENLKIYKFTSEIELTYSLDGKEYAVKGPYGPDEDHLLHLILSQKGHKFEILETEFGQAGLGDSAFSVASGFALMLLPFILVLILAW